MACHLHIIILDKDDAMAETLLVGDLHDLANQLLSLLVLWMGLSGKDDLHRHLHIVEDTGKTIQILH